MLDRLTVALLSWLLDWEILLFPRNSEKNKDLWLAAPVSTDLQCFRHHNYFLKPQLLLLKSESWLLRTGVPFSI